MATKSRKAPAKAARAPRKASAKRGTKVEPLAAPNAEAPAGARKRAAEAAEQPLGKEQKKAHGQTESQLENKAYHEGDFQTTDPVSGLPRKRLMNWQDADDLPEPIDQEKEEDDEDDE